MLVTQIEQGYSDVKPEYHSLKSLIMFLICLVSDLATKLS